MICDWRTREEDLKALFGTLTKQIEEGDKDVGGVVTTLPCVQPFHSIVLPLPLSQMKKIARLYSQYIVSRTVLMELPKFRFRAKKPHQVKGREMLTHTPFSLCLFLPFSRFVFSLSFLSNLPSLSDILHALLRSLCTWSTLFFSSYFLLHSLSLKTIRHPAIEDRLRLFRFWQSSHRFHDELCVRITRSIKV